MNKNLINDIIISGLVSLFIVLGSIFIIIGIIKNEATKAKTELVEKVETVKNFNDSAAALSLAKTIHKFTSFKNKVKDELKKLDSSDSGR